MLSANTCLHVWPHNCDVTIHNVIRLFVMPWWYMTCRMPIIFRFGPNHRQGSHSKNTTPFLLQNLHLLNYKYICPWKYSFIQIKVSKRSFNLKICTANPKWKSKRKIVKKRCHVLYFYVMRLQAICVFLLHRLNIAYFASLNYWELNGFFFKPAIEDIILT